MEKMPEKEEEWKKKLSAEQFAVLRQKKTEAPFTGRLLHEKRNGKYICAGCGSELFSSETKFDSGTGWPSFSNPENTAKIEIVEDYTEGMRRKEAICKKCKGHLGHVFDDWPAEMGGKRYCVNSCALKFRNKEDA